MDFFLEVRDLFVAGKGTNYALKQFDAGMDGMKGFDNEIAAYARTKEVWGKLVPTPYFVSETPSGGVKLLGLQLGLPIDDTLVPGNEMSKQLNEAHAILDGNILRLCEMLYDQYLHNPETVDPS